LQSKSGRDLARYFPEVVVAAMDIAETQVTVDGCQSASAFRSMIFCSASIAATRINRLAAERPAVFLAFDLLRCGTDDMARLPLRKRRPAPERFAIAFRRQVGIMPMPNGGSLQLAAAVTASSRNASIFPTRVAIATACRRSSGYALRTVIGGFRCGEKRTAGRKVVGSLLLGLYDQNGLLSHVGFTSGLKSGRGERRRDGFPMIRKPFSARDLADIMHEGAFADIGSSKNSAASQDYPNDLLNYNLLNFWRPSLPEFFQS
jgi:hypothetical protein